MKDLPRSLCYWNEKIICLKVISEECVLEEAAFWQHFYHRNLLQAVSGMWHVCYVVGETPAFSPPFGELCLMFGCAHLGMRRICLNWVRSEKDMKNFLSLLISSCVSMLSDIKWNFFFHQVVPASPRWCSPLSPVLLSLGQWCMGSHSPAEGCERLPPDFLGFYTCLAKSNSYLLLSWVHFSLRSWPKIPPFLKKKQTINKTTKPKNNTLIRAELNTAWGKKFILNSEYCAWEWRVKFFLGLDPFLLW